MLLRKEWAVHGARSTSDNAGFNAQRVKEEHELAISVVELKAAYFGLRCFTKESRDCDTLLRFDNIVAISYVSGMREVRFRISIINRVKFHNQILTRREKYLALCLIYKIQRTYRS